MPGKIKNPAYNKKPTYKKGMTRQIPKIKVNFNNYVAYRKKGKGGQKK